MSTRTIQKPLLIIASALGISGIFSNAALAETNCYAPEITIDSPDTCSDTVISETTTISNSGVMDGAGGFSTIRNEATITNLTNFDSGIITNSSIFATIQNGVYGSNLGTINLLNNYGSITSSVLTIYNGFGSIDILNNYNSITSSGGNAIQNDEYIGLINNTSAGSSITGSDSGIYNGLGATISNISNAGNISGLYGIQSAGDITSGVINNNTGNIFGTNSAIDNMLGATISGATQGILNQGYILSDIEAITNSGTISSLNSSGSAIQNSHTLGGAYTSIFNLGNISGTGYGILNEGNIGYVAAGDTSLIGIENVASGTISANDNNGIGIQNSSGANIFGSSNNISSGSIENNGSILGSLHAINNEGSIGYISSGNLTGLIGIQNFLNIGDASTTGAGIQNTGTIFGVNHGIYNHSNGIIQGQTYGISNSGSIGRASTYESVWGIENWGTIQSNGIAAIYNAPTGIIAGSAPQGAVGGGILNETSGFIAGNIKNEGTIKSIINMGEITGNITNSGNIEAVNVSPGTFGGQVYNSGHIEELYLGSHTLFLTGNSATLGPAANYGNGATINIGIDESSTANFTSTAASQFTDPMNMLSNFNINAGSTFNAYEGESVIRSTEFTNNGTLNIKAGSQLTVELGISPMNAYTQNGRINMGINGSSSGQLIILGGAMINGSIGILPGSLINEGTYASIIKIDPSYGTVTDTSLTAAGPYFVSNRRKYSYEAIVNTSDIDFPVAFDLRFTDIGAAGPDTADTQAAIRNSVARLRGTFNAAAIATGYANMNTYDCNLFDKNNMCIAAGGRYTSVDSANNHASSAVVVLGYKVSPQVRIGGFFDQSFNHTTPQGLHVSNKNPMMGAFAVWNASQDGSGLQIKLANAYQDKDISTLRDVIGTSEAGRGNTSLNIQSYVGELSYAFKYQDRTIVRPYFALRHTKIKQDAYTEEGVDTALAYDAIKNRATTSLAGLKLNHALTPKLNLTMSLGLEHDLNYDAGQYIARSSIIENLQPENLSDRINKNRAVASLGAYFTVNKTQRLSADFYYQELPSQNGGSRTAYVNYMIGF